MFQQSLRTMPRLLVATGNRHKTEEIGAILGGDWQLEDLNDHPDLTPAVEDGDTFEANAVKKALGISRQCPGVLVLADDSGLEVDVLGGAPGVRSARYAGTGAGDADNRIHLLAELARLDPPPPPPLTARFRCVLALARDGGTLGTFDGTVEGRMIRAQRGRGGFGYDPLFVPEGHEQTFAELPAEVKNGLSHRARALAAAIGSLQESGANPAAGSGT